MSESEHLEQTTLVNILRKKYPLTFAIPNGGLRSKTTAAKLKREGVLKGIPDLMVVELGLFIELKAVGGKLSPEQKKIIADINETTPFTAIVAYGYKDALEKIAEFELSHDTL